MTAEHCLDAIKNYLIGMVESWVRDGRHIHAGITSIVSSFDVKKDYKYLTIRCPSNIDSGVTTSCASLAADVGSSTTSLPRTSQLSRESPLATEPPSIPPRSRESFTTQSHKISLQDSHTNQSVSIRRTTVNSMMPVGAVENYNAISHGNTSSNRVRKINQPMTSQGRRSYASPNPIERRVSAPVKLRSLMERQKSGVDCSDHQTSTTPPRSQSTMHSPVYAPPLPQRKYSRGLTSSTTNTLSRIMPTLGKFEEDEEDDRYAIIEALNYIVPRRHGETDYKSTTNCKDVEDRPNIAKLQKKLCKRNSTLKKRKHPSVHKRSLTHSSDASSDDSEPKPHRRVSSYHPPRRISLTKSKIVHRNTTYSFPNVTSLVEKTMPEATDVSILSDQDNDNIPIAPTSDGDDEVSEYFASSKHSVVRHIHLRHYLDCIVINPHCSLYLQRLYH